jgi:hypothetical protein
MFIDMKSLRFGQCLLYFIKRNLIIISILLLIPVISCGTNQETVKDQQVFTSPDGNCSITISPSTNVKQGDTLNLRVDIKAPHQIYINRVELQPLNMLQWPSSVLYRQRGNPGVWPSKIPTVNGGTDSKSTKTVIPVTAGGTQNLDVIVRYSYAEYDYSIKEYIPKETTTTISFALNLPDSPNIDNPEIGLAVPQIMSSGATLVISELRQEDHILYIHMTTDGRKVPEGNLPGKFTLYLIDEDEHRAFHGDEIDFEWPLKAPVWMGSQEPIAVDVVKDVRDWYIPYDIGQLGNKLFMYYIFEDSDYSVRGYQTGSVYLGELTHSSTLPQG